MRSTAIYLSQSTIHVHTKAIPIHLLYVYIAACRRRRRRRRQSPKLSTKNVRTQNTHEQNQRGMERRMNNQAATIKANDLLV